LYGGGRLRGMIAWQFVFSAEPAKKWEKENKKNEHKSKNTENGL